jgi:hypothetical protein
VADSFFWRETAAKYVPCCSVRYRNAETTAPAICGAVSLQLQYAAFAKFIRKNELKLSVEVYELMAH